MGIGIKPAVYGQLNWELAFKLISVITKWRYRYRSDMVWCFFGYICFEIENEGFDIEKNQLRAPTCALSCTMCAQFMATWMGKRWSSDSGVPHFQTSLFQRSFGWYVKGTVFFVPKMNVVDFSLLEWMEGLEKMWSAELYDMWHAWFVSWESCTKGLWLKRN
jgi:hypothetical protein